MVTPPIQLSRAGTVYRTDLRTVRLGVVSPMANEEASAVEFVDAVLDECACQGLKSVVLYVIVDSASRDETRALLEAHELQRPELQTIWAPENRGVAHAYIRGYREALRAGCDWILELDAGFSHDPKQIGVFLNTMVESDADCVFGTRFRGDGVNRGKLSRRVVSRGGTWLANVLVGSRLTDMTSGYQLFRRATLEMILRRGITSSGPFFQTEMKAYCRDLNVVEIPITYNGGQQSLGASALGEAFVNLCRLFARRVSGRL